MLRLIKIKLRAFRSFVNEQTLIFPSGSGFYFLTGENKVEPHLSPSAAGKTSLLDGITWALFGKTTRGQGNTDVSNWQSKQVTKTTLDFVIRTKYYRLTRTHNPNTLQLTNKTQDGTWLDKTNITQEQLNQLTNLDFNTFLVLVMQGQFNRYFFDRSPAEKLSIFTNALQLTYWERCINNAKNKAKDCQLTQDKRKDDYSEAKGQLLAINGQLADLKNVTREQLTNLNNSITNAKKSIYKLTNDRNELTNQLAVTNQKLEIKEKRLALLTNDRINLTNELTNQKFRKATYQEQLTEITNEIKLTNQNQICNYCGQELTKQAITNQLTKLTKKKEHLINQLANPSNNIAQKQIEIASQNDRIEVTNRSLTKLTNNYRETKSSITNLTNQLTNENVKLTNYQAQRSNDPFRIKSKLRKAKAKALRHQQVTYERWKWAESRTALTNQWANYFKEIRLQVIREAVIQLEVETASNLNQLGLTNWQIKCDVEKVSQKGKVTKGFNVSIISPTSQKATKWENWCGTETQRLRIAGNLALASLVRNRRQLYLAPEVEFWDEPTSHLNEDGVRDLLTFFEHRAKLTNKQIWIIDHRSLKAGNFERTYRIIKTPSGSKITNASGVIPSYNGK